MMNKQQQPLQVDLLGSSSASGASGETDTQNIVTSSALLSAKAFSSNSQLSQLNFPCKLHRILNNPEYSDIICWLPHGRSWRLQQQQRFEKEVLPIFFRHGRYASFARQINGWGFRRIASGPDFNSYHHELFLRDAPDMCLRMTRPSAAELAERKRSEPDSPPNFYLMPKINPESADPQQQPPQIPPVMVEGCSSSESSSAAQGDDYMINLIRRIAVYAPQQQDMMLQLELGMLDKQRQEILEQMKQVKTAFHGSSNHIYTADANVSRISPTMNFPSPQERESLQYHQVAKINHISNLVGASSSDAQASFQHQPMISNLAQRAALEMYLQQMGQIPSHF
ncbi:unnamed protein product [Cylindrotheca closterium]|uniref:HSF-type DNA-binding domain-containing protein n=1 Tax=Cylindrotheca closterium TaxID=2856 RepID=A0AAD2PUG8_9STRA|nr:unnamed protein product [Cylindrotheca closterium]